ncbi:MAG: prepilin-type N-terminal cleavage/methylation domain-containing protein [Sedimentisphaerales bacterium]|nr:prepilin-type N-terminal cleavage/methylation domain-containing protein [Sedimentisphaerales bacterium]
MKRKAFTLIELLVVVAIIALLMAVLVPALRRVKQQATGSVCLANVKGLSTSWHTYCMDNDERLVYGHVPNPGRYDPGQQYWVSFPQDDLGNYKGDAAVVTLRYEQNGIKKGALFPYINSYDAYHCPGDKSKVQFADQYPNKPWWNSYSIPGLMNGEATFWNDAKVVNKMSDIVSPGYKIIFLENSDPRGWIMGSWLMNYTTPAWNDPIAVWHKDRGSLGFADGHAEMHLWVDPSTITNATRAGSGVTYAQPQTGEKGDDIRYMQQAYIPGRR